MKERDVQSVSPPSGRHWIYLLLSVTLSVAMYLGMLSLLAAQSPTALDAAGSGVAFSLGQAVPAAPIPWPEGYPKLSLSTKSVTPTLVATGGAALTYTIEIWNTGASTATNTSLVDALPPGTSFTGQAWASHGPPPDIDGDTLS